MARVPLLTLVAIFSLVLPAYCSTLPAENLGRTLAPSRGLSTNPTISFDERVNIMPDKVGDLVNDTNDVTAKGGEETDFPLDKLDDAALAELIQVEDDILVDEISEHIAKKLPVPKEGPKATARAFLGGFSKTGVTQNGSSIASNYTGYGNYKDALRVFRELHVDNVKPVKGGRIGSYEGTMGKYVVTVRYGSGGDRRPTLEIRSDDGNIVRVFRYAEILQFARAMPGGSGLEPR